MLLLQRHKNLIVVLEPLSLLEYINMIGGLCHPFGISHVNGHWFFGFTPGFCVFILVTNNKLSMLNLCPIIYRGP